MVSFEIKWGTKKFTIDLDDEEYIELTVHELKAKCQQLTEVEPEFMKLLAHGGIDILHCSRDVSFIYSSSTLT